MGSVFAVSGFLGSWFRLLGFGYGVSRIGGLAVRDVAVRGFACSGFRVRGFEVRGFSIGVSATGLQVRGFVIRGFCRFVVFEVLVFEVRCFGYVVSRFLRFVVSLTGFRVRGVAVGRVEGSGCRGSGAWRFRVSWFGVTRFEVSGFFEVRVFWKGFSLWGFQDSRFRGSRFWRLGFSCYLFGVFKVRGFTLGV